MSDLKDDLVAMSPRDKAHGYIGLAFVIIVSGGLGYLLAVLTL